MGKQYWTASLKPGPLDWRKKNHLMQKTRELDLQLIIKCKTRHKDRWRCSFCNKKKIEKLVKGRCYNFKKFHIPNPNPTLFATLGPGCVRIMTHCCLLAHDIRTNYVKPKKKKKSKMMLATWNFLNPKRLPFVSTSLVMKILPQVSI